jgi:dTDP-4-amino-4,6-dideoxygalactose transaminase
MNFKVPWSGLGLKYTEDEINTVINCMRGEESLTQGKMQEEFESKFNFYMGSKSSFAVSSCTSALELAATLSQVGPGDEVIIPAHTFCASALPFGKAGARLVWADIDKESRLVTRETIEPLLTDNTKVIVVVHLYGLAVDMDPIMELAREKNILVVEDAAQAPGASYKDKKVGSIGDFGCFSFHTAKNISTLGEGGMLTVNNEKLIPYVKGLRHNGVRAFEGQKHYWQPGMSNVDFDIEGVWPHNFCMGEVQCALGIKLLDRLDEINKKRKERAAYFIDKLSNTNLLNFQKPNHPDCENIYHLMVARFDGEIVGKTRDDLYFDLTTKYKIKVINPYYPLYKYPLFEKAGFGKAHCPNTEEYFSKIVAFPFHLWMPEEQFEYLLESVQSCLKSYTN